MSGVSQVSVRPGPSQPRGRLPVTLPMASAVFRMSSRSFVTFCMLRWVKPWPTELPFALGRGLHDVRIGVKSAAVDVHHAGNIEFVVDVQQTPEAHAIAVFMPAP